MIQRVRPVRVAQGYPCYKFAASVGVHPNLWHEIEMGKRKPSEGVMLRASQILKRSIDDLFADAEEAVNCAGDEKDKRN